MAAAQTYQSDFTGEQMDERFRAVATLAEALAVLEQAIAAKYTKPADGIPSTDMDASVQSALALALTSVQSLADYYTKTEVDQLLAAINGMDYVDVSTLPTASASTMGKIYLVGPDASGYYSYYYTSYNGSAYSWVGPLGTTQISLANYATKTELNQLDQKVTDLKIEIVDQYGGVIPYIFKAGVTYIAYSFQAQQVNLSTRETPSGTKVDGTFALPGNGSVEFTATADAYYLRVSQPLSGCLFEKGSIAHKEYLLEKELQEQTTIIETTQDDVKDLQDSRLRIKPGKNLFDKDSPLLLDNSCFSQDGTIVSDQYTTYWMISNPINVTGHGGKKIICNKSYNASTRYCCFEDAQGNKTTVLASVNAYTIPADAVTAYILVYKASGSVNLGEVQIEFGAASSDYEPYNPGGGYFTEEVSDETIFPPSPQPDKHETFSSINTAFVYGVFDSWAAKFPSYITKTNLGRDASNTYDVNGYKIAFATNPVYKIMFICNQHGGGTYGDPVMGAFIATQFINDICGSGHRHNERLRWIRNNVEIYIIPAANPWGIDNHRRVNYNGVNLNRNWPTSGWDDEPTGQGTDDYKGASAADQPELQHYLQYISDVQPDIIIDNHTLGGTEGAVDANSGVMYIGFNKDAIEDYDAYVGFIAALRSVMQKEYAVTPYAYGNTASTSPDCRVWCSENDYFGGLIEMQWRDPLDGEAGFTPNIIEASYMLCLSIYQYYATKN